MQYTHFGKQAEVWKHLPLCDVMINEKPLVYIETNSAYADYTLTRTPEQEYGIFHFLEKAENCKELRDSKYFLLETSAMKEGCYLGSPALAMNVFQSQIDKYVFFDIDNEALKNIARFSERLSLTDKVKTINQDSRIGLKNLLESLPESTLLHIDPYEIIEQASNGYSYLDLFVEASSMGIKCFLWYGFNTLEEKERLNKDIKDKVRKLTDRNLLGKELIMEIIEKDTVPCNPGILGSGLLTSNLSEKSLKAIEDCSRLLVDLWKGTTYQNYKGDLYQETIVR